MLIKRQYNEILEKFCLDFFDYILPDDSGKYSINPCGTFIAIKVSKEILQITRLWEKLSSFNLIIRFARFVFDQKSNLKKSYTHDKLSHKKH